MLSIRSKLLLVAVLLLAVACGDDGERIEQLEAELAEMRAAISTVTAAPPSPRPNAELATVIPTESAPTPVPIATSTSEPVSPPSARWIANTDGAGLSIRTDCDPSARSDAFWPEGLLVQVIERGVGRCAGWSLGDMNGVQSWVHNSYLAMTAPLAPPLQQQSAPIESTAATSAPTVLAEQNPPPTPAIAATQNPLPTAVPQPTVSEWDAYAAAECAKYRQAYLDSQKAGAAAVFLAFIRTKIDEWC